MAEMGASPWPLRSIICAHTYIFVIIYVYRLKG